ncbi:hypothetical protein G9A89_021726 [Geosiphon pyriformis]|nr:hypothetical protein G9A89_021726 [Geosiphon pyriformis]
MSETQIKVALFEKKFSTDNVTPPNSTYGTIARDKRPIKSLTGPQFWPNSHPASPNSSEESQESFLLKSNGFHSSKKPLRKFLQKIWTKVKPNDSLRGKIRGSSADSQSQHYSSDDEAQFSSDDAQKEHSKPVQVKSKGQSSSNHMREKKKRTLKILCCPNNIIAVQKSLVLSMDDAFGVVFPSGNPRNNIAISRSHTISYPPRNNINPLWTPDERISRPVKTVHFIVHIYWNWPKQISISIPRDTPFSSFKMRIAGELNQQIPRDFKVLYHTKRYNDDDVMKAGDERDEVFLKYLVRRQKIRVIDHDALWSIGMLMWRENVEVTLFSELLLHKNSFQL